MKHYLVTEFICSYFTCTFLSPCIKGKFSFLCFCILMNNKDLFDLIKMGLIAADVNTEIIPVVRV